MQAQPTTPKLLYSVRGLAEALDCSVPWAKKLVYSGRIPSLKIGNARRVRREDVEHWINENARVDDRGVTA